MEGIPVFILLIVFWIFRTVIQSAGKANKNANQKAPAKTGAPRSIAENRQSQGTEARIRQEFPHLYQQAISLDTAPTQQGSLSYGSLEGVDPCHDDPRAMPSGSLGRSSLEGTDPCHDDYHAIPSGSLGGSLPEGTDPCHENWHPLSGGEAASDSAPAEAGGLNLRWTGDEMVKGFVYGEILRRKAG